MERFSFEYTFYSVPSHFYFFNGYTMYRTEDLNLTKNSMYITFDYKTLRYYSSNVRRRDLQDENHAFVKLKWVTLTAIFVPLSSV